MISEEPSLAEIVQHGVDAFSLSLFKAGPGIITSYDPLTNTAVVQPAVAVASYSATDGERSYRAPPVIPSVPVIFPRSGAAILRMPVDVGDTVLLVFTDSSLAEWRESGGTVEPEDARRHGIGWPVAIVGLYPDNKPPNPLDAVAIALGKAIFGQDGGMQVRTSSTGIEMGPAGVPVISPVALAVPLMAYVTAANAAGLAGGASDAAVASALTSVQAALTALTAILANAAAAPAVAAAATTVSAAVTALGASATAATAAGAAATVAAGAVPSTSTRAV